MAEKKQDFVVSDRRRFGVEGELRSDAPVTEEEKAPAAPPAAPAPPVEEKPSPSTPAASTAEKETEPEEMPAPPTAEEQQQQSADYKASSKKLEDFVKRSGGPEGAARQVEMSFERLVESFYMTALIQLGAIRSENEPPRVDIIGARQTIDSLNVLLEKTKGNLSDRENTLLQNVLFELRMAWIEITNAIASGPPPGSTPGGVPGGIKK